MKLKLMIALAVSMLFLSSCAFVSTELPESQMSDAQLSQETTLSKPEENLILEMDSSATREVNLFLSKFSEVFYDPNLGFYSDSEGKINFAYLRASIDFPSQIFYKDGYWAISDKSVDNILERFFGSSVAHETPKDNKYWLYKDGNFLLPATPGVPCPNFCIATNITKRQDGNYDVTFNVYSDPSLSEGDVVRDKSVYFLSDSEAASKYKYGGYGYAVLKEKVYDGENTYELVLYDVNHNLE